MLRFLLMGFACIGLFTACKTSKKSQFSSTVEQIIYLGPQRIDCVGVGPMQCFQIKENPEDEYTLHYGEIDGFTFQAGYEYTLKVWKKENVNPPADAPSWEYVLVEEISKTPMIGTDVRLHDIWVVTTLDGQPLPVDQNRPRLELFPVEGRLSGNGGCNTLFGSFTVDDDEIQFSQIGATKMYCAGLMDEESTFLRLLGEVDHFQIRDLQLILLKGDKMKIILQKVD